MNDFEIIHSILMDSVYSGDQLIFELELNKINDNKLRLGLLFDIYARYDHYQELAIDGQVDRDKVLNIIKLYGTHFEKDELISYRDYFLQYYSKKERKDPSMKDLMSCIELLEILKKYPEDVIWMDQKEIVDNIKSLTPEACKYLKNLLLEKEHYQEIVYLDKCIEL